MFEAVRAARRLVKQAKRNQRLIIRGSEGPRSRVTRGCRVARKDPRKPCMGPLGMPQISLRGP